MPLLWLLRRLAWLAVRRHRPIVIGITGSVGKTTTKDLIAELVQRRYRTWATPASASGELGAALTVLGVQLVRQPWREWASGFARAAVVLALPRRRYAEVLVVEMAAGRPGELRRMTRAIRPDVAVVLNVRRTHIEHFRTLEAIADEKAWLVRRLRPGGTAILNADDERVAAMAGLSDARVVRFGRAPDTQLRLDELTPSPTGIAADVRVGGRPLQVRSPLLGEGRATSVLAALAIADLLGIPDADALEVVRSARGPAGRLRALRGRHGSTVIDDTYSASPDAVEHALEALRVCESPRRAVLGELSQLGPTFVQTHLEIGEHAGSRVDELVAVGPGGRHIAAGALASGMDPERVRWAADAAGAASLLEGCSGGTVLVTGAHGLGLEHTVRSLLLDPRDPSLLDRVSRPEPTRRPLPERA